MWQRPLTLGRTGDAGKGKAEGGVSLRDVAPSFPETEDTAAVRFYAASCDGHVSRQQKHDGGRRTPLSVRLLSGYP